MCKIDTFQGNLSTIFSEVLNIYLFLKIFQKVEIVMLRENILQYLTKMLRQYFNSFTNLFFGRVVIFIIINVFSRYFHRNYLNYYYYLYWEYFKT